MTVVFRKLKQKYVWLTTAFLKAKHRSKTFRTDLKRLNLIRKTSEVIR